MTKTAVLAQLRAMGTVQNRKVYARHGVSGEAFGVSYANLGKLKRKIRLDHGLAAQLWATGNHDARILATMIADPTQATAAQLDSWVKDVSNHVDAAALANVAVGAPSAFKRVEKWTRSRNEWIGAAGWNVLAGLAVAEGVTDEALEPFIETIEAKIHGAKNRVRYSMNNALIAIGARSSKLQRKAVAAAKRIGKVEVDHGDTGCKTPDAVTYIHKTVEHRRALRARREAKANAKSV